MQQQAVTVVEIDQTINELSGFTTNTRTEVRGVVDAVEQLELDFNELKKTVNSFKL